MPYQPNKPKRWRGPNGHAGKTNKRFEEGSPEHEAYKIKQIAYYEATKIKQREGANYRVQRRRERNQQFIINYLHDKPCEDCGCDDIRILTFDHREPKDKFANISDLVSRGAKFAHLKAEIEKCDIVCHNCHMLRMFVQRGGSYHESRFPITEEQFAEIYGDII